jgi:3-isopropylmalate dehydrogenase
MTSFNLAVLPGDGIGPDVTNEGIKVLKAVGDKYGHSFNLKNGLIGGIAIDETGEALTKECLKMCKHSDAVLLGAVGGPKWDDPQASVRPEDGLLALRQGLGLFANLRPVKVFPMLVDSTNLKPDVIRGVDFIFVRELGGHRAVGGRSTRWSTPSRR